MVRRPENLTVTRADIAEFMAENGDDPNDVALFLYDRGLTEDEVNSVLGTLDSY